ncbi:hypothetical protein K4K54_007152 [Colletotrichum sp. SAR 10_86]|nr:hypothetical protein K4K54_007152 [Colletotrichum sp. SAR 10_86]
MGPMPDDAFIPGDRDFLYSPRCSLILTPHEAPRPWGHHYPDPFDLKPADMEPTDEEKDSSQTQLVFSEKNRPLRFDQEKQKVKDDQLHVVIVKMIPDYGLKRTLRVMTRVTIADFEKIAIPPLTDKLEKSLSRFELVDSKALRKRAIARGRLIIRKHVERKAHRLLDDGPRTNLPSPEQVRLNLDDEILRSEVRDQLEALVLVFSEDPRAAFPPVFADEAAPKPPCMKEMEEAAQSAKHRFHDMAVGHIHKTLSKAKRFSDPGVIVDASKLEEARLNGTSIIEVAIEDIVKNHLEQVLQSGDPSLEHFQKKLLARSTKMRILRPIEMTVRSTFQADTSEKEPHQTSAGSASESHTLARAFETLAIDPAQETSVASEDVDQGVSRRQVTRLRM